MHLEVAYFFSTGNGLQLHTYTCGAAISASTGLKLRSLSAARVDVGRTQVVVQHEYLVDVRSLSKAVEGVIGNFHTKEAATH